METNPQSKILVVDKPGVARMLMCHYLESGLCKVTTADDYISALDELRLKSYNLIILDTFADPLAGLEFMRTVRKRFTRTALPILLATSMLSNEIEVSAFEAGANDFISKPVKPTELLARVRVHLDIHRNSTSSNRDFTFINEALKSAEEGVWCWDLQSQTIRYSECFMDLLEPEKKHHIGNSPQEWFDRIHPEDKDRVAEEITNHLDKFNDMLVSNHRLVSSNNSVRWVMVKGQVQRNELGHPIKIMGTISDISNSIDSDGVTGLYNNHVFCEWLRHLMAIHQRSKNLSFAVIAVNIDNFGELRQQHDSSDINHILAKIAQRLPLSLRATDLLARLDIACFGIILSQVRGISATIKIAMRIQEFLSTPIIGSGQEYKIQASIGIAFSSTKYDSAEDMVKAAVKATFEAPEIGQNKILLADKELASLMVQRLNQEKQLQRALKDNMLVLSYSPILDIESKQIFAYQAILNDSLSGKMHRVGDYYQWSSTELTHSVDNWSLEAVLREVLHWQGFDKLKSVYLCFPVQIQQLIEGRLFKYIEEKLEDRFRAGLSQVCLEISEESLWQQIDHLTFVNRKLKEHNLSIGINKFGLGQTSLRLLTLLPIKYLKLSPNFIDTANKHSKLLSVLHKIAKELDYPLISTGINTKTISSLAQQRGLNLQQGRIYPEVKDIVSNYIQEQ